MGRLSACCLALALLAGPASACINDKELPSHEREFRSQYARAAVPPVAPGGDPNSYRVLIGGGAALLFGGATIAVIGGRSRA